MERYEIKVVFENGDFLYTKINGTKKEIKDYYINKYFNTGFITGMQKCIRIEFLNGGCYESIQDWNVCK